MVFTNTGRNVIRDWLAGSAATAPTRVGVGNNNNTATEDDTTLAGELVRIAFDSTDSTASRKVQFAAILDSTQQNGQSLKELGLFNAATNGDLFIRVTHATLDKSSSIDVEYLIELEVE
jgi:hypothetical protein